MCTFWEKKAASAINARRDAPVAHRRVHLQPWPSFSRFLSQRRRVPRNHADAATIAKVRMTVPVSGRKERTARTKTTRTPPMYSREIRNARNWVSAKTTNTAPMKLSHAARLRQITRVNPSRRIAPE
jgi:hypothetical protein